MSVTTVREKTQKEESLMTVRWTLVLSHMKQSVHRTCSKCMKLILKHEMKRNITWCDRHSSRGVSRIFWKSFQPVLTPWWEVPLQCDTNSSADVMTFIGRLWSFTLWEQLWVHRSGEIVKVIEKYLSKVYPEDDARGVTKVEVILWGTTVSQLNSIYTL